MRGLPRGSSPTYRSDLLFAEDEHHDLSELAHDLRIALARACAAEDVDIIEASEHSIAHHA